MSEKKSFICDVCDKLISDGHQQLWMARITVEWVARVDDGSAAGHENRADIYHVHNDFSNHCMSKIWDILVENKQ